MKRMGMVIGIAPERVAEYKRLHAAVWPGVLERIAASGIRNYTIYLREPENLLFGYWEYAGTNYAEDMKVLGERGITKKWLALTDPCQARLPTAAAGEWWSLMPEIFHLD